MTTLKDFTVSTPRPLPVIILVDVSGSMKANGKIDALNAAMADMIASFAEEANRRVQIEVAIITFGQGEAKVHHRLQPASQVTWENMEAAGKTPLGGAFDLAREMLEDRGQVPSRAYIPTIVLVSDGRPTDEWRDALSKLLASERGRKAARLAMAIGDDAEMPMLNEFLADATATVFLAHEARQIKDFFRQVTMSVSTRSQSSNPNNMSPTTSDDLDY